MKLTTGILILGIAAGSAWAQNPDIIDNTRSTMNAVVQKKAIDSNAALAAVQSPSQPSSASTPAPAVKHAAAAAPAAQKPAAKVQPAAAKKSAAKVQVATAQKPNSAKKVAAKKPAAPKEQVAVENSQVPADAKKDDKQDENKQISLTGRRDPFVSPVVNRSMIGSGCSTGKKCLAVDQINLKGVIRAESGMIAVVVNAMNKAYFLRENDPVFNGYVVRITGDSIIFKETMQDKLGKNFTREVTKKIITPAV
jgi:Tfp pilus assembly protein PilP